MKDNQEQDQHTEDHEGSEKTEWEAQQRESAEVGSGEEESNIKPSEVEGFQENVQQLKEKRLEMTSKNIVAARNEVNVSSVDEEELLEEKAKRVVVDISGVEKVSEGSDTESESKSKVTVDEMKNENTLTTSEGSAGASQLSSQKYSDKGI